MAKYSDLLSSCGMKFYYIGKNRYLCKFPDMAVAFSGDSFEMIIRIYE